MPIQTSKNEEDRPSPQRQRELFGGDGGNTAAVPGGIPGPAVAPPGMPPPHLPVQPPGGATWTNALRDMVDNTSDGM